MKSLSAFTAYLISESILLPFIIGLVRFRRLDQGYLPFFIVLALGALNEPINYLFIKTLHSNAIPNNVYSLAEWVLLAWQFRIWGLLRVKNAIYFTLVALIALIWVTEDLVLLEITIYPPYFQVFYCFLIVLFSVNKINFMITHDDRKLYSNPIFLICIGFIIFFIYRIIYEWAYQTSVTGGTETTNIIIMLFGYVNALTNIIFAIALLKIPRPQKFTLS